MNKWLWCIAALTAALAAAPARAQYDMYLTIEGIKGEVAQLEHRDWIDIFSWSWGVNQTGSGSVGSGGGAGRAVFADFSWLQQVDASVVPIFLGVASGRHYQEATLDVALASMPRGGSFFQMIFAEVTLESLQTSGSGAGLHASASLDYEAVKMRYRPQDAKGGFGAWVEGSFSLKDNQVQFSGDPLVIQGLLMSGGDVSLGAMPSLVPEPAGWAMLGLGLLAVGAAAHRRRKY